MASSGSCEIGTGTGVGTAWLASALPPGVPLYTAERDETRAAAAAGLFADDPDVHVLEGDWRAVLPPHGPFDLLFVDGTSAKDDPDAVLGLATPGATVVVDDVSVDGHDGSGGSGTRAHPASSSERVETPASS